ncbi:hypothetical protein SAMN04487972_12147 [Paracoccus halophilus]|uniref:Uncharacterized protein n=1 Tax=Paracoccus halophilus TaxID=376733 RepID=A0A1I0U3P6_9RHOB|nr:hypothetical protein SAMN04487972_12147 [Paracoccus halophilus]
MFRQRCSFIFVSIVTLLYLSVSIYNSSSKRTIMARGIFIGKGAVTGMGADVRRRPRGIPVNRELVELAKAAHPNLSISPPDLVHVTSVGWGRRIVDTGNLEKRRCSVFGKELVYFFLSRPAYRFGRGDEKNDQLNFFPFVIVLSPAALPPPYHVYPFDTGAYMSGFYDEVVDPSIYIDDYELEPNLDSAVRHIEWAFVGPDEYLDAKIRTGLAGAIPQWRSVAQSWIRIASLASVGREKPDRRASAIEFAYGQSIDLRQGHGRLLIFPTQLLEDPNGKNTAFLEAIQKLNIEFTTYDWSPNETPDSFADIIEQTLRCHCEARAA